MPEFHGLPSGVGRRIVVIASRFNEPIVQKLVDGALEALVKYGVAFDDIDVVWVPGAWELPLTARWLLASERYDGIVAVGAVIRGETAHFDYIAGEASRGSSDARGRRLGQTDARPSWHASGSSQNLARSLSKGGSRPRTLGGGKEGKDRGDSQ